MDIKVREFVEADREPLRQLFLIARCKAFFWAIATELKPEDFDQSTEGEQILVAVNGDTRLGFASIWQADNFLHNLFVHPDYQRQGVGRALLHGCVPYFAGVASLKCVKANSAATAFYQSMGWTVRSEAMAAEGPYLLMEHTPLNPK